MGTNESNECGLDAVVPADRTLQGSLGPDAWAAIGDPTRRAILERLAERPWAVGELAGQLPVSRPAVSQHLAVLKAAGFVTERTSGTRRIYRLNPAAVGALRDQLDAFWRRALAGYDDLIDRSSEETSQ